MNCYNSHAMPVSFQEITLPKGAVCRHEHFRPAESVRDLVEPLAIAGDHDLSPLALAGFLLRVSYVGEYDAKLDLTTSRGGPVVAMEAHFGADPAPNAQGCDAPINRPKAKVAPREGVFLVVHEANEHVAWSPQLAGSLAYLGRCLVWALVRSRLNPVVSARMVGTNGDHALPLARTNA